MMSDFELHRLCQQYSTLSSYQLDTDTLLDSGKFRLLTQLLASITEKVRGGREPTAVGVALPHLDLLCKS